MNPPPASPEQFVLDPQLAADSFLLGASVLSQVLLVNDARWPWLILVPRIAGLRDLIDLPAQARQQLYAELDHYGGLLRGLPQVRKLNIAALGNVVAQLHIHLIGRWDGDPAWPKPVWGTPGLLPYSADALAGLRLALGLPAVATG